VNVEILILVLLIGRLQLPNLLAEFFGAGKVRPLLRLLAENGINAEAALQGADVSTVQRFDVWNSRIVDLPGVYFAQTAEWIFRENRLANGSFPALGREVGLAEIVAPIFALAASDDAVVTPPQVTAVKSKCRRAKVAVRVEPGRNLSLFMGRRTLTTAWRDIAHWLGEERAASAKAANEAA
jgi:poly(3-hydroxyalkanoate) synthetase